jgi:hypothetical protein
VPLSSAEKQRRYRERKRAEEEARYRYDRGLSEPPPEPVAPNGAYLTGNGHARPKQGHYEAMDGTYPPIPDAIRRMTYTKPDGVEDLLPELRMKQIARDEPVRDGRDGLYE